MMIPCFATRSDVSCGQWGCILSNSGLSPIFGFPALLAHGSLGTTARDFDLAQKHLSGTDSPLDNVATALHLNLRGQVKYGHESWKALQTATL